MQPLDIGVSAISAGTTQAFGGQVVFSNSNGISFGVNGHTVTATFTPSAGTAVSGLGVSTGGNTSGNTGTVAGTVVLAGINNITLSQATAPGIATITISGKDAIFGAGVSTGGNSSGSTGTTTGTLVLAGGNNITLSQSTNAGGATITISGATTAASATVVSGIGVSTGGNTLGNTGTRVGTVVLAGIGNITLSQSTAAGSLATITISGSQSTAPGAIAAGTQTGTSGTIVFSDANNVSFGMAGNSVVTATATFSQSVQPGVTAIGVSTGGNTAGNTGTTQGTYILAGGNNITLSQVTAAGSLATVTISGRDAVFGAGISTGGNTSGTSGTNTGTFVLAGGNNVTLSQATGAGGNTITISGRDAIFGAGVSTGGNTSGTTGTVTGTLVLAGGNNVTLSQSTNAAGATITISAASAAAGTVVSGIGVSTLGNTSGDTGTTVGTVVFAAINNITLSQSTAAGSLATITISGRDAVFGAGISTGGNTSGTSGTNTGTFVLAGGNGITLSQATGAGGNTVTISGITQSIQPGVTAIGVSTGGNTSGDTGTTQGTYILAGGNNITLSQSTAAGSLATVTISARDAIFGAGVSTGGNTSGTTGTVTGTLVLAGGNGITLSQSTNAAGATITVSAANSATVVSAFGVSTGGNTAGNTGTTVGTVVLAAINNITLSQSTAAGSLATITISGRDAVFGAGISTGGNTSGTSGTNTGTFVLAGGNNITLSQATGAGGNTVTISSPNMFQAGVSTGGNTSGSTGTVSQQIVFVGGNNVTLSQSTGGASSATITISAANSATVVSGIGVSTGGNTAGNTGTTVGTVIFAGGNQITLSQSTAAGSLATITISGRDAVFGAGISTGGNTSGTSGTNTGTFVLVGGNNITLSQATGAGGNTITISAPNAQTFIGGIAAGSQTATSGTVVFSNSNNVTFGMSNSSVVTASIGNVATTVSAFSHNAEWISNFTVQQGIFSLQRVTVPANVTMSTAVLLMDLTGNSNSTGGLTVSVGIYTMSGSTASLSTSFSNNTTWTSGSATSASAQYGGNSGTRYRGITFNTLLTQGDYLFGIYALTTNNGTWRIFGRQGVSIVGQLSSPVNVTQAFIDGVSTSSFTTAMPASINVTDTNYNRTGVSAQRQPGFMLLGE